MNTLHAAHCKLSDIWPQALDASGRCAGFALVAPAAVTRTQGFWTAQFFVLKAWRRAGLGRTLARWVFDARRSRRRMTTEPICREASPDDLAAVCRPGAVGAT